MSIRAVFFDMGGTIQTFGYTRELRLAATPGIETILQSAGIHSGLSNVELLRVITEGLSRYHAWSLETMLELPPQRVWREFIFPGYPVDVDAMDSVAEEVTLYIETHYYQREMRPEMPKVLESIKKLGLKIGLISNVCSRGQVPQNLNEYGIQDYFDPIVLSSEYGRRKPDPAIFHYAARLANVPTSECVYVGDRIARDILGARKAGFGYAIQIRHDFEHGESDEGATPDISINRMTELVEFLSTELNRGDGNRTGKELEGDRVCALLFDAGDILYHRPERGCKLAVFLSGLGLKGKIPDEEAKNRLVQKAYRGQINLEQFREGMIRLYGVTEPYQIEKGKMILTEEDEEVQFFEGVQQTLLALKEAGYLLGIITDTVNPISVKLNWFEQGGFAHVWDSIISSQELGIRKPDPGIYKAAMTQLGVTSKRAVFVGHKASELDGARAVGMKTIAFNYEKDAKADFYIQQFPDLLNLPVIA
jgi:HAD superfamily hydrolase (TIGR01549 family)/HAD superfamily hydrolase (TIGR01509 family)